MHSSQTSTSSYPFPPPVAIGLQCKRMNDSRYYQSVIKFNLFFLFNIKLVKIAVQENGKLKNRRNSGGLFQILPHILSFLQKALSCCTINIFLVANLQVASYCRQSSLSVNLQLIPLKWPFKKLPWE